MNFNKKIAGALLIVVTLLSAGCKKLLEEHPQSGIVPSFFNSPAGVLGGISGVYNDIHGV